jgi:hypothetical protein
MDVKDLDSCADKSIYQHLIYRHLGIILELCVTDYINKGAEDEGSDG